MKINKIFLLITLVLLFAGLSYASEVSNDTTVLIDDTTANIEKEMNTPAKDVDNMVREESNNNKEIIKQTNTNKTTKTASKSYDVTNYDTMYSALTTNKYDTVTLNIKSNILLTGDTRLNEAIKKLTINGNGKTIDGKNQFQFLSISSSNTVTIKNIKITNCFDVFGGAIYNKGSLTITDSTLKNNTGIVSGGAIQNYGKLTVKNCIFNNNNAITDGRTPKWDTCCGGAIYNYGNTNITNTTFSNNNADYDGGAIYNWYGCTLSLLNCTLQNNSAANAGGAIRSCGNITIKNSKIINNNAEYGGAAIFHGHSTDDSIYLTVSNSIFGNNTSKDDGGAIFNWPDGIVTLTNITLNDNKAEYDGGAIYNLGKITITLSTLNNNYATESGGAINTQGYLKIKNSNLNNNYAEYGGAIYNYANNVNILNNTFMNNSAYKGSAVFSQGHVYHNVDENNNTIDRYYGTNLTVKNNNFVKNKANITGKAIIDEGINSTIKNNINDDISQDSSTVHMINTLNSTVTYNVFDDGRKVTVLTVNKIGNTKYGETITIDGMLKNSNNKALSSANIVITLNNKNIKVKTDNKGYYTYETTADTLGTNNVTVTYKGNTKYYSSTNMTSFTVKQPTMIKHTYMGNVNIGTTVKILGRLISNVTGQAIKYATVTVKINDDTYKIKSDGAGYVRMNYTVNSYDEQKITFSYAGSSLNMASSNSTSFKVKQPTWIKLGYTGNVVYGSTVKLVARLLTKDNTAVKYVTVNVTVNGKFYQVKSDGAGYIRLNYTVNTYDDQKVTYKFGGSSLYMASSNSTSFKVKQSTWIKHASIGKVKLGSIVKIVGRVLYNGTNSVKYVPVNVTVNGNVYQLKTDGAGYYRFNYTTTTAGVNTFTSNFGGNSLYLASTNSTKFTVVK